jgi:hypothetical protein
MVDVRPVRLDAGPPLFLLPIALIVLLFWVAVLIAQVAPGPEDGGVCPARHGDSPVSCSSRVGDHGVPIADDLGPSPAQEAELSWWRVRDHRDTVGMALIGTLGAAAGVVTFLLHRRARPVAPDRRLLLVAATTLLSMGLFSATVPVFGLPPVQMLYMVTPMALLAAVPMAIWQWQLSGTRGGGRVVSAATATVAVICYTSVAMVVFLLQSGFED